MTLQSSFIQMEQSQLDQLWKMTKMALVQSASMMEGSVQTIVEFHTGWLLSNGPPSDKPMQFSGFFNFPSLF